MNWDRIEGNWKQLKGSFQQQWGMLTDGEPDVIAGERKRRAGKIQVSYAVNKEAADKQLRAWLEQHTLNGSSHESRAPLAKSNRTSLLIESAHLQNLRG